MAKRISIDSNCKLRGMGRVRVRETQRNGNYILVVELCVIFFLFVSDECTLILAVFHSTVYCRSWMENKWWYTPQKSAERSLVHISCEIELTFPYIYVLSKHTHTRCDAELGTTTIFGMFAHRTNTDFINTNSPSHLPIFWHLVAVPRASVSSPLPISFSSSLFHCVSGLSLALSLSFCSLSTFSFRNDVPAAEWPTAILK